MTTVRIRVARSEPILATPTLPKMAVSAAKAADRRAQGSHEKFAGMVSPEGRRGKVQLRVPRLDQRERKRKMSVRAGREFLAIPGPTNVPDEVLRAMHRPAVDIYAGALLALTDGLLRDIARVFN